MCGELKLPLVHGICLAVIVTWPTTQVVLILVLKLMLDHAYSLDLFFSTSIYTSVESVIIDDQYVVGRLPSPVTYSIPFTHYTCIIPYSWTILRVKNLCE